VADFDVRVTHPSGLRVLATGVQAAPGRWHATAVRDFALALGRFRIAQTTVRLPHPVHVVVGVQPGTGTRPPSTYLQLAANALRIHSSRFGAYPRSTYSLAVMPDFVDPVGIEYPNLVFVGAESDLTIGHETGHQWFYSLVGNDQGHDPWLDEGLASWADVRAGGVQAGDLNTPIPPEYRNRLGEPMGFWDKLGGRAIHFGIYVGGIQALAALGAPEDVDCALRAYVTANAYRTATPDDLLAALVPFFPDARAKLEARGARFRARSSPLEEGSPRSGGRR
jgi:hypothetical protein